MLVLFIVAMRIESGCAKQQRKNLLRPPGQKVDLNHSYLANYLPGGQWRILREILILLLSTADNTQQVHLALGNGAAMTAELHFSVGTDLGTAIYFFLWGNTQSASSVSLSEAARLYLPKG